MFDLVALLKSAERFRQNITIEGIIMDDRAIRISSIIFKNGTKYNLTSPTRGRN